MAISPVAVRADYGDLYGSSMLPVLEELFMSEMEQMPMERERVFKVVGSDRDIYQSSEVHDLGLFKAVSEGAEYTFERPKQGNSKTFTAAKYGLGFSISEEMVSDGKFDLLGDMVRKLAKSGRESQEIAGMNIFNNGFGTETTADGLSVFNTAHTLPSGLTYRNKPTTDMDLSASSLEQGITDFDQVFVGDSGIYYRKIPKVLLVHPSQKLYAMELIGSDLRADTSDNNMNSIKSQGLVVVSSPRLTDTDAWFLLADQAETGLRIVARKPLETKAAGADVGFTTDSILYKARYRESLGVTHGYGIWGTSGA